MAFEVQNNLYMKVNCDCKHQIDDHPFSEIDNHPSYMKVNCDCKLQIEFVRMYKVS